MQDPARATTGFPTARIPGPQGGPPVEVSLIAQLDRGAGDRLFTDAGARQRSHDSFVDALDEPSARLAGTDLQRGDATALYSFAVGPAGHPFHRHAGHRVFTAVAGSGGARLRFSTASDADLQSDAANFVRALRHVDIPPDALFTVRFGGGTWHQFAPLRGEGAHPALFALSCHTDELGGISDPALRARIVAGDADIPMLTEPLPARVAAWLAAHPPRAEAVPTARLSLRAPQASGRDRLRGGIGRVAGALRRAISGMRTPAGPASGRPYRQDIAHHRHAPAGSLLTEHLAGRLDHEDFFVLSLDGGRHGPKDASVLLARVLEGFLAGRPAGVTWLMRLRNALVRPLRLRTSPLGCPVSSLLSTDCGRMFAGRYPVLDQRVDQDGRRAQAILGADDRHLVFRSCVGVEIRDDGRILVTLATRVRCRNRFGRVYMALIDGVHRRYVSPSMLGTAAAHAFADAAGAEPALPPGASAAGESFITAA
ncbi:DUF2867 domain-containing protein [Luteimonas sp. R10]|uniref:DUF2867 domain-containing protein n=1 Tax=Luteimonas sp. R10 TaxID=3108176 RepID=UPI00308F1E22|nr:DUF2867 domain-containing protein [Luteimonas sp. R10]